MTLKLCFCLLFILPLIGAQGYNGYAGYAGYGGPSSYAGNRGYAGNQGYAGYPGYSGYAGNQGYTGYPGYTGYSGYGGSSSSGSQGYDSYTSNGFEQSADLGNVKITRSGYDFTMTSPDQIVTVSGPNGQKMYNELKAALAASGGKPAPEVLISLAAYEVTMTDQAITMSGPGGQVCVSFLNNNKATSGSSTSNAAKTKTVKSG